jgi:hypothetical protein
MQQNTRERFTGFAVGSGVTHGKFGAGIVTAVEKGSASLQHTVRFASGREVKIVHPSFLTFVSGREILVCPNCNEELPTSALKCMYCGTDL